MLGLCRFCLDFSKFGYVTKNFYVPNFFYVFLKHRKSLGRRKLLDGRIPERKVNAFRFAMWVHKYQAPTHPLTHHCKRKVKTFKTHSFKSKSFNHFMTDRNGKFCKLFSIHSCIFSTEKGEEMWVGPIQYTEYYKFKQAQQNGTIMK